VFVALEAVRVNTTAMLAVKRRKQLGKEGVAQTQIQLLPSVDALHGWMCVSPLNYRSVLNSFTP
jgi:hypothetical protein